MNNLQRQLLTQYQKGFPLTATPFHDLAMELAVTEQEVIEALSDLSSKNIITRVGPVFDHKKAGASTLAAMSVPNSMIETTAQIINRFPNVNHNYLREHTFNLWFVVTASTAPLRDTVLSTIAEKTGIEVLSMPMRKGYHIDLSFSLTGI